MPSVNQIELHPTLPQDELRTFDAPHGIATEAWSPLGRGAVLDHPVVTAIADRTGKTPAQVVIRWHLQLGNVVIPKSVTPSGSSRTSRSSTSSSMPRPWRRWQPSPPAAAWVPTPTTSGEGSRPSRPDDGPVYAARA